MIFAIARAACHVRIDRINIKVPRRFGSRSRLYVILYWYLKNLILVRIHIDPTLRVSDPPRAVIKGGKRREDTHTELKVYMLSCTALLYHMEVNLGQIACKSILGISGGHRWCSTFFRSPWDIVSMRLSCLPRTTIVRVALRRLRAGFATSALATRYPPNRYWKLAISITVLKLASRTQISLVRQRPTLTNC
jgi:hypothetical protein